MDQSNNQQASGPQTSNPQVGGPQQEGDYKIGAGSCLQECDSWGRYSGPCGGSVSLADGSMTFFDGQTLYAAGPGGVPAQPAPEVPAEKTPAETTWKNDDPRKPDSRPEDLQPQMRQSLESIPRNTQGLDSININSGRRPDGRTPEQIANGVRIDPHAEGRAVDINRINGFSVNGLNGAEDPAAKQAWRAAQSMVQQAMNAPYVNQVIGPTGGWNRNAAGGWDRMPDTPASRELLQRHQDHFHINVHR